MKAEKVSIDVPNVFSIVLRLIEECLRARRLTDGVRVTSLLPSCFLEILFDEAYSAPA